MNVKLNLAVDFLTLSLLPVTDCALFGQRWVDVTRMVYAGFWPLKGKLWMFRMCVARWQTEQLH